jgi:fatty-acid peroxygenase
MQGIAHDGGFDHTLSFLREGYAFISNRCRHYQCDAFETRIMLQKAVCARGEEAARMFYAPGRFTRRHAMPPTALFLLQDVGSVAMRNGECHHARKRMFMSLMTPESMQRMVDLAHEQWQMTLLEWENKPQIVLHEEAEYIMFRAASEWAGILPLENEVRPRTRELSAMIDGAGAIGPRFVRGLMLRSRTEAWTRELIDAVRSGRFEVREGSAMDVISHHRDLDGTLLDLNTAAVELINILRPTVAVARYVTFAAHALEVYPEWKSRLQAGGDELIEAFVQEVRRYYPFFPMVGGRTMEEFEWRGHPFNKGSWVLLDLYGTNHDARLWTNPERFDPERFLNWEGNPFTLIPQGGGDFYAGHRCPGEWITIELVKQAVHLLACEITYHVPLQDLRISLSRMPAIPESRFIITHARKRTDTQFALPGSVRHKTGFSASAG